MIVADTSPYPWPFDEAVDADRTALVLCGADADWAARTPHAAEPLDALDRLRAGLAGTGMLEILLHHANPSDRPHTPTAGAICPPLEASPGSLIVHAAGIDGFYGSDLDAVLRRGGRTHLLFAGYGLETTLHSTMRRANDRGYECLLVADAALALDESLRPSSISSVEMSGGIFGAVGMTDPVLTAYRSHPSLDH